MKFLFLFWLSYCNIPDLFFQQAVSIFHFLYQNQKLFLHAKPGKINVFEVFQIFSKKS